MSNLELTDEEREILGEILQSSLTTLEIEIHRADDLKYKEFLKHRCEALQGLLTKIAEPAVKI